MCKQNGLVIPSFILSVYLFSILSLVYSFFLLCISSFYSFCHHISIPHSFIHNISTTLVIHSFNHSLILIYFLISLFVCFLLLPLHIPFSIFFFFFFICPSIADYDLHLFICSQFLNSYICPHLHAVSHKISILIFPHLSPFFVYTCLHS